MHEYIVATSNRSTLTYSYLTLTTLYYMYLTLVVLVVKLFTEPFVSNVIQFDTFEMFDLT